ncbi:hypothetical protein AB1Y20_022946 [Prymnesium parvum]|uniref:YDG domain-containing protein n=1 Tax=Prymnesium parvum TaxID=97485 RepID=A0AB34JDK2_PRYPA
MVAAGPHALFLEEQRKAIARGELRADVIGLNAVLRAHGAPGLAFGAPPLDVGQVFTSRAEMCAAALHRHFLSEATYTALGVESLVVLASDDQSTAHADHGERIYFRPSDQRQGCLAALPMNAKEQRPVRVIRAAYPPIALPSSATRQQQSKRLIFRYDGLYLVLHHAQPQLEESLPQCSFMLVRQAGQAPLSVSFTAAPRKRQREEIVPPLSLVGSLLPSAPSEALPPVAEQECGGSSTVMIHEALEQLLRARANLLNKLTPQEILALAKRIESNHTRVRQAIEQVHGAHETASDGIKHALASLPCRLLQT